MLAIVAALVLLAAAPAPVPAAALPTVVNPLLNPQPASAASASFGPRAPTYVQPAPTPAPDDFAAFAKAVVAAFAGKQWGYLLAMFVMGLVFALRKWGAMLGPKVEAWLRSDPGGVLLVFLTSFGTALGANAASAGGGLSPELLYGAFKVAVGAMGGFSVVTKLLLPLLKPVWAWLAAAAGNGPAQIAAVTGEAALREAERNAKPAEPGSASKSLEEIK